MSIEPPAVYVGTVMRDGMAVPLNTAIMVTTVNGVCAVGRVGYGLNNARLDTPGGYALQVLKGDVETPLSFIVDGLVVADGVAFDNASGMNRLDLVLPAPAVTVPPDLAARVSNAEQALWLLIVFMRKHSFTAVATGEKVVIPSIDGGDDDGYGRSVLQWLADVKAWLNGIPTEDELEEGSIEDLLRGPQGLRDADAE